jgi:hypothetical protein
LLPKEEVLQEMSFSTDASAKFEPDCYPLKLEPNINMGNGMFPLLHFRANIEYSVFKTLEKCGRN